MVEKIMMKLKFNRLTGLTHKNRLNELESRLNLIERNAYLEMRALEYKFWQFNSLVNVYLYKLDLKNKIKKNNFSPLVSIVVPVYNGSNYLDKALESALRQSYGNIEIIVVNDGSTDNGATKAVVKKFSKKIRYYEKKNGGVSSALNFGIKKMRGDYFAWLSHDDLIDTDHIENLVNHVSYEENSKDIPFAGFKIIDESGRLLVNKTIDAQIYCADYKVSSLKNELSLLQGEINGGSVLIPKEAFAKHGMFDETQRITQERDMWSRLMSEYHFISLPFDTASIRMHDKQVTETNPNIIKETNKKNLSIIKALPEERKSALYGSVDAFYGYMKRFYYSTSNQYMVEEIDKIIKNLTNCV